MQSPAQVKSASVAPGPASAGTARAAKPGPRAGLLRRDRVMVAITVVLDVAFHGSRSNTVSAADIAERLGMARRGMEPLLQTLSRAGLLESVRGPRGGYRLGRSRRDIKVADIVSVVLSEDGAEPSDGPSGRLQEAVVDQLWDELDSTLQARLSTLTVDDLMRRATAAGLRRPTTEPITFAI